MKCNNMASNETWNKFWHDIDWVIQDAHVADYCDVEQMRHQEDPNYVSLWTQKTVDNPPSNDPSAVEYRGHTYHF